MCQRVDDASYTRECSQAPDRQAARPAAIETPSNQSERFSRYPFIRLFSGYRCQVCKKQRTSRKAVVQGQTQRLERRGPLASSHRGETDPTGAEFVFQNILAEHVSNCARQTNRVALFCEARLARSRSVAA